MNSVLQPDISQGMEYVLNGVSVTSAEYTSGFSTSDDRKIKFTTNSSTPMNLYYFCKHMAGMGAKLHTM
jgi:hypothetical protein